MISLIQQLFAPIKKQYSSNIERATLLFNLNIMVTSISSLALIFSFILAIVTLDLSILAGDIPGLGALITGVVVYGILRAGYLSAASYIFVIAIMSVIISPAMANPRPVMGILSFATLPMVALLLNWRFLVLMYPFMLILIIWNIYGSNTESIQIAAITPEDFMILSLGLAGFVALMILINRRFYRLTERIKTATDSLALVKQFKPDMSHTELELMGSVIRFVQTLPNYQVVQVFMVNDLQELNGYIHTDLGIATLDTLPPFFIHERRQNAIVEALSKRQSIVVTTESTPARRAHLQPGNIKGICVPVMSDEKVLAVLDIQTNVDAGTGDEDIMRLEIIAAQTADKLLYKRQLLTLESDLNVSENIMLNQQRRLRELEQLERQSVRETWGKFMEEKGKSILGFDFASDDTSPVPALNISQVLETTLNQGNTLIDEDTQVQHVSIPINLRGQILGAIGLDIPVGRALNQRQIEMLENMMQRLALALENKRLYEQSQSQVQREIKASSIGDQLLASTDVETILQMAAARFNDTLGAIQTHIQIEPDLLQTQQIPIVNNED